MKFVKRSNLTLEEFRKLQNVKITYGSEAEYFILNYEKKKFINHSLRDLIEQISIIDVAAGYDIASFQRQDSINIDKFIEVKSYSNKLSFYWSRNEVSVAKREKNNYFLYLVNRDEMNNDNYQPTIIQNPYKKVFSNKNWQKDCQSWKFKEI